MPAPAEAEERAAKPSGCGGRVGAAVINLYERRFQGKGSVADFLSGEVYGLTSQARATLQEQSPGDLVENVLLPAWKEKKGVGYRVADMVGIWAGSDLARRSDLYELSAALPPLCPDTFKLEQEGSIGERARLSETDTLFEAMFPSISEHFRHLEPRVTAIFGERDESESNLETDLAIARRIIFAINSRWGDYKRQYRAAPPVYDAGIRQRDMQALLPFVSGERSIPFRIQKDVAEAITRLTREEEEIPPHVLWLALSSTQDDVTDRVISDLSAMFEAHDGRVTAIITNQIRQTPADYEHRVIWFKWADLVSAMETSPSDELFNVLKDKLMLAEVLAEEQSDPSSVGSICRALDTILNHPANAERKTELIEEADAYTVLDLLLELYLKTEANANTWDYRAQVLNLAEGLGQIAKDTFLGSKIEEKIIRVNSQPDDNFAPAWFIDTLTDALGRPWIRMPEKEAAQRLSALVSENS